MVLGSSVVDVFESYFFVVVVGLIFECLWIERIAMTDDDAMIIQRLSFINGKYKFVLVYGNFWKNMFTNKCLF